MKRELKQLIEEVARNRYPNNNPSNKYYWSQVFIKELKKNGYRDIWIGAGKGYNDYGVNVYEQYLIHRGKLYHRTITARNRMGLSHDIKKSVKKWVLIK